MLIHATKPVIKPTKNFEKQVDIDMISFLLFQRLGENRQHDDRVGDADGHIDALVLSQLAPKDRDDGSDNRSSSCVHLR